MKSLLLMILATLFLAGCASAPQQANDEELTKSEAEALVAGLLAEDSDESEKYIYQFQHRILPEWTHHSDGQFYDELRAGDDSYFREVATEILGEDYANSIEIQSIENEEAVLINFPEPKSFTHCYAVLILKNPNFEGAVDTFQYITLEKTLPHDDHPRLAVLGNWNAEGSHGNFGARTYTDAQTFLEDVLYGNREMYMSSTPASASENN
ncbi:hypothetical protein C9927_04080 [Pseudidiomarina aestuarii]|uniref:Uncharacterized protein n=1 Tax=Pseudidiomarina aestuarii TaxID=624146 RepID=A0A2T4D926_9GAMM|nr:hypothetical protein C9927_04080 [Pseudidiomarina aestuarii]PTB90290.1 hypothetical protein C9928_00805 [Pseudidiomarina aestuarii]